MDLEAEVARLTRWEDAYYNGEPIVPDTAYDDLRDIVVSYLRNHNPQHPYLDRVGAPTPDGSVWSKFTHTSVMGSLFKVNNREDFIDWTAKRGQGRAFFLSEKADGCTITAYYENGALKTLATRGDGFVGEDITANARYFENVRANLPNNFTGVLRGEGIIYLDRFEQHFAPLGMANPRNAASGKVRDTKNPELKRHITVTWFDVLTDDATFETWTGKFDYMRGMGLQVIPHYPALTAEAVWDIYESYVETQREALNYWIDGLVARVDNLEQHDGFGVTDNRPKGSIAIKFPANGVATTLNAVEFNRGRSGRISVVGLIEPVLIDGTTVGRVSMHGLDWITAMDVAIGDRVEVAKAGDIIPQIIRVIQRVADRTLIQYPDNCPDCGIELVKSGAYIECKNPECAGQVAGALAKWIEKLDIKGLGPAIQTRLLEEVDDPADLYEGDLGLFARAAGSDKVGQKIYKNVLASKQVSLAVFLSALHIDTLGSTNGQRIANRFKTLDATLAATEADFRAIEGIDANAERIWAGLQNKRRLILRLAALLDIEEVQTGGFTGMSFCITGKLSRKRGDIEAWIKAQGGICKGAVARDLTYLVTNTPNSGSSKNKKAEQYGVKRITEEELFALGGGGSAVTEHTVTARFREKANLFGGGSIVERNLVLLEKPNNQWEVTEGFEEVEKVEGAQQVIDTLYRISGLELDIGEGRIRADSLDSIKQVLSDLLFVVNA